MRYAYTPPHHAWDDYCRFEPFTGKFCIYHELNFEGPLFGTFTYKNIKIKNIELVSLDIMGEVHFPREDDYEILDTTGSLVFLDPNGAEIASIDLDSIEIHRDWLERVNNLFGIDLEKEMYRDAEEYPIEP